MKLSEFVERMKRAREGARVTFPSDPRTDPKHRAYVSAGVAVLLERGLTLVTDKRDSPPGRRWWVAPAGCTVGQHMIVAARTIAEAEALLEAEAAKLLAI